MAQEIFAPAFYNLRDPTSDLVLFDFIIIYPLVLSLSTLPAAEAPAGM